jgi:photosystem II stability/assembly factor-like uncharacterized protein
MLKTTNCGDSWDTIKLPPIDYFRSEFFFLSEDNIVFTDNHNLYKSTNSGKSWVYKNSLPDSTFFTFSFLNDNIGWVSDYYSGDLYKTTDGGENWTEQFLNKKSLFLFYYKFLMKTMATFLVGIIIFTGQLMVAKTGKCRL